MEPHDEVENDHEEDSIVMDADNPHRYLFGGDPVDTPESTPMPPPQIVMAPPRTEIVREKPPSSKPQSSSSTSSKPKVSKATPTKPIKFGEYDDRFKTTIDFHTIMTTLVKLKDQREQALADLKGLEQQRLKSEADPKAFVSTLLAKREVIPRRQLVAPVPSIDMDVYEALPVRPGGAVKPEPARVTKKPAAPKSVPQHTPWTMEEQQRLEQLLIEYPDEPVAAYRWEKIARALGRTPKQVVSRIHRYFERLARAGLPVPGRLPTHTPRNTTSSDSSRGPQTTNRYQYMEAPAVKMDAVQVADATLFSPEEQARYAGLEDTAEFKELQMLKRMKAFQEKSHESYVQMDVDPSPSSSSSTSHHHGSTHRISTSSSSMEGVPNQPSHEGSICSSCNASPIVGSLFRCRDCSAQNFERVTLCSTCFQAGTFNTATHNPSHAFDAEQHVDFVDNDYALPDEMAYLDERYAPT